ncbi:MAG: heme A synthase [Gammaproteobacteria bacterium]|nr:heme A synthase [Gammaproteobacteria bacterium]
MISAFRFLSYLIPIMAFIVITKGAYVRLSDAGLGCPDWPGCYGRLLVPTTAADISESQILDVRPLETGKAWREMIHRYLASSLGLLILMLAAIASTHRHQLLQSPLLPLLLVPLVIFQGLLGMWTVTLLLKPLIVVAHLVGGISILALAWWNLLNVRRASRGRPDATLLRTVIFALVVLLVQILLGGWTSANYAALACADFPTCHGQWWPNTDFSDAFSLWQRNEINYEFGVLETPARTAIHLTHRYWAVLVTATFLGLILYTLRTAMPDGRLIAWCILALLALQIGLGITNVVRGLPLLAAVMHNGVAALLLIATVTLLRYALPPKRES